MRAFSRSQSVPSMSLSVMNRSNPRVNGTNLLNFAEVYNLLTTEIELKKTTTLRKYFRVKSQENAESRGVPFIIFVRMTSVSYKNKTFYMISFTEVGLMLYRTKMEQEKGYQKLLINTLGHEKLTPLNTVINQSKDVEKGLNDIVTSESVKTLVVVDPNERNKTKEVVLVDKMQLKEMQEMANIVHTNGMLMLYLANSQRSHFSAEKGTLPMWFKPITSQDEFLTIIHNFIGLFSH